MPDNSILNLPDETIQKRNDKLKQKVKQRRKEFEDAKEKLSGNPELIEAIESLEKELDVIREAINL